MRRLIVNADDFGYTSGVNRAVAETHRARIVTSATLMATGAAFDDAVRIAHSNPGLSVGCHIVLLDGSPLLPASQIPGLITQGKLPAFRQGWGGFSAAALRGALAAQHIEAEATAQIRKLQQAGIRVSHVDTHKHVHIFPQVLQPVLSAAKACNVDAIRNPFEPARLSLLSQDIRLWRRWLGVGLLNAFAGSFRRTVRNAGMISPKGTLGIIATGKLNERLLRSLIEHMPQGTWELVCHPGYDDAQLRGLRTKLLESRQKELQILTCPDLPQWLTNQGVDLISYCDLVPI
jgi:hopanoid biosynthesis associated protein HpnK